MGTFFTPLEKTTQIHEEEGEEEDLRQHPKILHLDSPTLLYTKILKSHFPELQ